MPSSNLQYWGWGMSRLRSGCGEVRVGKGGEIARAWEYVDVGRLGVRKDH